MVVIHPFDFSYLKTRLSFFSISPLDGLDIKRKPILAGRSINYLTNPNSYISCPYSGSRSSIGKDMNFEALKYYLNNSEDVLNLILVICRYVNSICASDTFDKLHYVASIGFRIINYSLVREAQYNNMDLTTPPVITICSRLSHGLTTLTHTCYEKGLSKLNGVNPCSLYSFCESSNLLVGRKEVCAASEKIIKKILFNIINEERLLSDKDRFQYRNEIHFASLCLANDLICLTFETIRIKLLRVIKFNESPKILHAVPHCSLAYQLSSASYPFDDNKYLGFLKYKELFSKNDELKEILEIFLSQAANVNRLIEEEKSAPKNREVNLNSRWTSLKSLLVEYFNLSEVRLANSLCLNKVSLYSSPEIYRFFGAVD